eukprot:TRINITY_DN1881_c0_g1_i1.p1 TRINITY_DN1881_c0_g1~~TRINITY_DN1881_c0_g1_i1.p1  ORF type:complete len:479 (-),score=143.33 TRINITY_DN1881_c0_g1_i1:74-1510(-)
MENTTPPPSSTTPSTEGQKPHVDPPRENDYKWIKELGRGAFGVVKLGQVEATGVMYAVKVISKQDLAEKKKSKEIVYRERTNLHHLGNHPFIVSLHYTFQSPSSLFFVMDYCPNGDMFGHIKKLGSFSKPCVRFYMAEMIVALEFMHSKRIVHRDFKPENILFTEKNHIKIIDFGTAKCLQPTEDFTGSFEGTPEYMSPELLFDNKVDFRCDLWALGVIAFQLTTGRLPFRGSNAYVTMQKVKDREFEYPAEGFDEEIRDVVEKLLERDLEKRFSLNALKSHKFFDGIDWKGIEKAEIDPPKLNSGLFDKGKLKTAEGGTHNEATESSPFVETQNVHEIDDNTKSPREGNGNNNNGNNSNSSGGGGSGIYSSSGDEGKWSKFVTGGEKIEKMGIVSKKRRAFNVKKRQLILTNRRLFYVDPQKMAEKGSIELSKVSTVESKGKGVFVVNVPGRAFMFEDKTGSVDDWVSAITKAAKNC